MATGSRLGKKLTTAQRIKQQLDAGNRELDRAAKLKKMGVLGPGKKPSGTPTPSRATTQMKPKARPTAAPSVSMKPKARPTAAPIRSFRPKMRP